MSIPQCIWQASEVLGNLSSSGSYWTDEYGLPLTGSLASPATQKLIWVKLFDGNTTRCEMQTVLQALKADMDAMGQFAPAINIIGLFEVRERMGEREGGRGGGGEGGRGGEREKERAVGSGCIRLSSCLIYAIPLQDGTKPHSFVEFSTTASVIQPRSRLIRQDNDQMPLYRALITHSENHLL